jgi:hypothetical protein
MSTLFVAEVVSPCGGRTLTVESDYLAGLEAAIDRAFGIACDEDGRELGALGGTPRPVTVGV